MSQLMGVGVLLGGLVAVLLAFAPQVSGSLVRSRARRLPRTLSPRMEEEWLAELDAMLSRPSQLAFAIALTLTRRHSFSIDEDSLFATPSRPPVTVATIGGWPSVLIASTMAFAAIAYGASFLVLPMYLSTARIRVVPSRIPEAFVESPVRLPWHDRLQRVSEQVLSQTSLERLILDADLYRAIPPAGAAVPVSAGDIARMRRDIDFQLLPDGQSFEVSYLSPDPQTAMKVAERLAGLYIKTSVADRELIAHASSQFLDAQIDDVRSRLLSQAAEIRSAVDVHAPDVDVERLEHEQLTSIYRGLLMKREHLLISANLEQRALGEWFTVLDPARVPETPISPNRLLIAGEGAAAGFFLGVTMMLAGRRGSFQRLKKAMART
jgi:hypothetical protein